MLKCILQNYITFTETWKYERYRIMVATRDIKAVYEDDMNVFLSSIGILNDLENGLLSCYYCGVPINMDNFFACFPAHTIIAVCCDKPNCKINLMEENSF